MIVGSTIIYAYLLAITVFLLDFVYALVDPRVKVGGQLAMQAVKEFFPGNPALSIRDRGPGDHLAAGRNRGLRGDHDPLSARRSACGAAGRTSGTRTRSSPARPGSISSRSKKQPVSFAVNTRGRQHDKDGHTGRAGHRHRGHHLHLRFPLRRLSAGDDPVLHHQVHPEAAVCFAAVAHPGRAQDPHRRLWGEPKTDLPVLPGSADCCKG